MMGAEAANNTKSPTSAATRNVTVRRTRPRPAGSPTQKADHDAANQAGIRSHGRTAPSGTAPILAIEKLAESCAARTRGTAASTTPKSTAPRGDDSNDAATSPPKSASRAVHNPTDGRSTKRDQPMLGCVPVRAAATAANAVVTTIT